MWSVSADAHAHADSRCDGVMVWARLYLKRPAGGVKDDRGHDAGRQDDGLGCETTHPTNGGETGDRYESAISFDDAPGTQSRPWSPLVDFSTRPLLVRRGEPVRVRLEVDKHLGVAAWLERRPPGYSDGEENA